MLSSLKSLARRFAIGSLPRALRAVKIVFGFTLLLVGAALVVLPGPAFLVIPLALAILAGEFVWARNLLQKFNSGLRRPGYPYGWFSRFRESLVFAVRGGERRGRKGEGGKERPASGRGRAKG
ncbi:MAG: hypothetical protein Kow0025_06130 [Thermodesulfovibrionales bacterium]